MSIELVTLEEAKRHLHITDANADADVTSKIAEASAIVLRYYKHLEPPMEWWIGSPPTGYNAPDDFKAAVLLVLSELYFNREASNNEALSETVRNLIPRQHTLA